MPIELLLLIFSYVCDSTKIFYIFLLLSKDINNHLKKYENITKKLTFKVRKTNEKYFIENIHWINKDKWIKKLDISYMREVTDDVFVHLKGISILDMRYCSKITDKAFENLFSSNNLSSLDTTSKMILEQPCNNTKINILAMNVCRQKGITEKTFQVLCLNGGLDILHLIGSDTDIVDYVINNKDKLLIKKLYFGIHKKKFIDKLN